MNLLRAYSPIKAQYSYYTQEFRIDTVLRANIQSLLKYPQMSPIMSFKVNLVPYLCLLSEYWHFWRVKAPDPLFYRLFLNVDLFDHFHMIIFKLNAWILSSVTFNKLLSDAEPQFTDNITYFIGSLWEPREIISKVLSTGTDENKHLKIVCSMISILIDITTQSLIDLVPKQVFISLGNFWNPLAPFFSSADEEEALLWIADWPIVRIK